MREQLYLRIGLAATAVVCVLSFVGTREHVDLIAAGLFALVTYSTGQRRSGAFLGAMGAGAALLVIRVHQYLVGAMSLGLLFVLSVALALTAIVLAAIVRRRVARE
jgi:hypothetical protein